MIWLSLMNGTAKIIEPRVEIPCLQLHAGPELKLRRLKHSAKELSAPAYDQPEKAMELTRAIWERSDRVMDPGAEALVVRPGDMRIMVEFEEWDEYRDDVQR